MHTLDNSEEFRSLVNPFDPESEDPAFFVWV